MNKYQEALDYFWKFYNENAIEGSMLFRHYLDELQELVDKATPKKPEQRSQVWNIFMCPNCHCAVDDTYQKYCEECGQMLRSDEDGK